MNKPLSQTKQVFFLSILSLTLLIGMPEIYFSADTLATTDDGKRVFLNSNGTWKYHQEKK
jgi:hypothetical protein